jgi:probable H4MPT-linked C1 transfer pathway protein
MIGIDVGGANLKVVDQTGVHIHYCPLWDGAPLGEILRGYRKGGDEAAAVVMSGELADCFSGKEEGVAFIVDAVREVFPAARFYGIDGRFHDHPERVLAAANWLAAADYLRVEYPDSVLVDIGSTTTDIIPLGTFADLLGLTDTRRLQKGYLVYTGILRTSLPALIREVSLSGVATPVSTEYFACSGDVHRVLGHITKEEYAVDTPDHGGKGRNACLRRLARVVCADIDEIGEAGAVCIAASFWEAQRQQITDAVARVVRESGAGDRIITAGIGAELFSRELGGRDLTRSLGPAAGALPAYAVREVAIRQDAC